MLRVHPFIPHRVAAGDSSYSFLETASYQPVAASFLLTSACRSSVGGVSKKPCWPAYAYSPCPSKLPALEWPAHVESSHSEKTACFNRALSPHGARRRAARLFTISSGQPAPVASVPAPTPPRSGVRRRARIASTSSTRSVLLRSRTMRGSYAPGTARIASAVTARKQVFARAGSSGWAKFLGATIMKSIAARRVRP